MEIQSRDITTEYTYGVGNTVSNSNTMDNDVFYKLLAAQLQNQDPMESMDNTQLVLQMAQFAQIEAANNLNEQFATFMELNSMSIGADMVGKEVMLSVQDEEGNSTTKTGIVERVGYTSSGPILQVDGEYHEIWTVISVAQPGASTPSSPTTDSAGTVDSNTELSPDISEVPTEETN